MLEFKVMCFAASYAVAFALELWHLFRPRPILRYLALCFGAAGLLAHIAYLIFQAVPLQSPTGSLLLLALILAVFYVGEAIHHYRIAWAVFVLPIVLGLIGLAVALRTSTDVPVEGWQSFWGVAHGTLLILAGVGVSIGFIASVMYLVQLRRLQAKLPPGQGVPLMSLERLEQMNRRAILAAFPLLTAGLLAGFALTARDGVSLDDWLSPKILSVIGLWIVFAILLILRYGLHARGRQMAIWTMVAFAILVVALIFPHSFAQGGGP
jgi:ABC-type uncharacterized transport system permease subunit